MLDGTPKELEVYKNAQIYRNNQIDAYLYEMGIYMQSAIGSCFSKKAKYFEKPQFQIDIDESNMTQEEKDNIEIQKMIMAEKKWQANFKRKGLPTLGQ